VYACFNLAEIWHTNWGTKGEYQYQIWGNLIKIQGVISDFMHKTKSNFCHAYRVNRFEEQAEIQYAARLSIRGVPFGG